MAGKKGTNNRHRHRQSILPRDKQQVTKIQLKTETLFSNRKMFEEFKAFDQQSNTSFFLLFYSFLFYNLFYYH